MSDTTKTFYNHEASLIINNMTDLLDYPGKFGYAIARNYRRLNEMLVEYEQIKNQLLDEYGEDQLDDEGNPIGTKYLAPEHDNYKIVFDKLQELDNIEHEVNIFTISYDDLPEDLTARQILSIQWMLDE